MNDAPSELAKHVAHLISLSNTLGDRLPIWVLYDRPTDFPDHVIARLWTTLPKAEPTEIVLKTPAHQVEILRFILAHAGFTRMARDPDDDPNILETWI